MFRVLLVSTRGSFRASLGAALLRDELRRRDVAVGEHLLIDAAGIRGPGEDIDPRVLHLLERRHVAKDDVVSAPLTPLNDSDVRNADLVLTMDRGQRARVAELAPRAGRRVFCLREFADLLQKRGPSTLRDAERTLGALVDDAANDRGLRPPPRTERQDRVPSAPPRLPLSSRRTLAVVLPAVRGVADALAPALRHEVERDVAQA